jgi:hypothetical protein
MAKEAVSKHNITIRLACASLGISETCYRYQAKLSDENAVDNEYLRAHAFYRICQKSWATTSPYFTLSPINRRFFMAKGLDKKKNIKKKGKTLKEKRAAKKEKKRSR